MIRWMYGRRLRDILSYGVKAELGVEDIASVVQRN